MRKVPNEQLRLFRNMIRCNYNISFWIFDADINILDADSDMPDEFLHLFSFEQSQINYLLLNANTLSPVIITNQLSMLWLVEFEPDSEGQLAYIHMAGPIFTEAQSNQSIRARLSKMTLSTELRDNFAAIIDHIPQISLVHFLEYSIMMQYCITGQKITASDFSYTTPSDAEPWDTDDMYRKTIRSSWMTWNTEQQLLRQIEDGNLHYKDYVNQLSYTVEANHIGNGSSLRQYKNLTIIYTALCTRAAIRGGLDPDIAYDLSDRYINSIENCRDNANVAEINSTMQEDFVRRVHRAKTETNVSPQIQKCCSYIQLHLGEQISLAQLAGYIGYSESHLSKKFKEDTGKTIKEYIMECRIEQAKQLLHTSSMQIAEICDQLGFTSQSYFGSQFRKATGMTPSAYRNSLIERFQS